MTGGHEPLNEDHPRDLVISIVSWNTADLLRECLHSLRRHTDAAGTHIVVVDNASSDGTPEMVRSEFPEVTLIESGGNLGFGKAHNLVSLATREPFVLFLNPDTEFVDGVQERMMEVMRKHSDTALVGCRMVNLDGSVQQLGWQWHTSPWTELVSNLVACSAASGLVRRILPWHDPLKDGFVRKLYGGCLLARRSALDQIGWFDERFFMYGEDVDLSRRVETSGWRLFYLSSAHVIHLCGGASAKAPGRFATLMQCESISRLMTKYYGPAGRVCYSATVLLRAIIRLSVIAVACMIYRSLKPSRSQQWENALQKQVAALQWSLGLARPSIPGLSPEVTQ